MPWWKRAAAEVMVKAARAMGTATATAVVVMAWEARAEAEVEEATAAATVAVAVPLAATATAAAVATAVAVSRRSSYGTSTCRNAHRHILAGTNLGTRIRDRRLAAASAETEEAAPAVATVVGPFETSASTPRTTRYQCHTYTSCRRANPPLSSTGLRPVPAFPSRSLSHLSRLAERRRLPGCPLCVCQRR